ncbi:hypothetical protein GPALN_007471 [Globodera pallida]|nr:hypothetical protein GPALN_007471 [Globodera pallida]
MCALNCDWDWQECPNELGKIVAVKGLKLLASKDRKFIDYPKGNWANVNGGDGVGELLEGAVTAVVQLMRNDGGIDWASLFMGLNNRSMHFLWWKYTMALSIGGGRSIVGMAAAKKEAKQICPQCSSNLDTTTPFPLTY